MSLKLQTISGNNQCQENKQELHTSMDPVAETCRLFVNTFKTQKTKTGECKHPSFRGLRAVLKSRAVVGVHLCTCLCDWPVAVRSLNCSSFMRVALVSSSSCRSSGGMKNADMLFTVIYTDRQTQNMLHMMPLLFLSHLKHARWQTPLTAS